MTELQLSTAIEEILVARNPRNMQLARAALEPGYYLRAAQYLQGIKDTIIIGTGFPVTATFETDGPVGAIALYDTLEALGARPILACGPPLSDALIEDYRVMQLTARDLEAAAEQAREQLQLLQPAAIISIERPGLASDGRYYNMRGEDITARCAFFDPFLDHASCPTVAIGDGGNEIGMGNIATAISSLDINASVTRCDELLVADVSNWGAYGLIAILASWSGQDLLAQVSPVNILDYLSARGSVDGVTRENTLTEDGLEAEEGLRVIQELRILTGFLTD
ncbi:MAG: DUF4392 domain-containing protein [Gammaproteobacteria bacterium]|nr:DUF4392 domain-containing protein [Gammaproteobacteria bacterium]